MLMLDTKSGKWHTEDGLRSHATLYLTPLGEIIAVLNRVEVLDDKGEWTGKWEERNEVYWFDYKDDDWSEHIPLMTFAEWDGPVDRVHWMPVSVAYCDKDMRASRALEQQMRDEDIESEINERVENEYLEMVLKEMINEE